MNSQPAVCKLYLVDDHAILREGLRLIISGQSDLEIIGENGNAEQALDEIGKLEPDILITDISMPGVSGIDLVKGVKRYYPKVQVIILSRHDNEEYIQKLVDLGINGYVLKDDAGEDLLRAIDAVRRKETYLSPRIATRVLSGIGRKKTGDQPEEGPSVFSVLSDRERQILKLISEGNSNEKIGKLLHISPATVKVHRANIMKKLDLHKVADLVVYAIRAGIVES
ncbi:response regulator [Leptospira wolffii]|uniref:Response regulator n=1 Tax=Leptospira wolffii TaxID=409998 RepID=A0ABV5BNF6_9LEPT|nr:response regulator transcription factor [Leptospira wolffii]EPG64559.1 response regulator receiver domain protein [Leptospira wolffii serovar Khorat str. Khorat-H2]TGK62542.1 DNA-binding response regulator [Leptospira wolffii]TGK70390.1 DNA-binding response regulator [Leptospira wolffii]TGK74073.1 DNA-binding response regulator [Leptospira wolffii]TGL28932.1 DNA-binding response regulator [Leptospira wolffii]